MLTVEPGEVNAVTAQQELIQWQVENVRCQHGGPIRVPLEQAPFGRVLPYRRAAGGTPQPGCASLVRSRGWIADFGQRGLTELLLGLGAVTALRELTPDARLHYSGPQAKLMQRCSVPLASSKDTWGPHIIRSESRAPVRFRIDPDEHPTWLDHVETGKVDVHAALPVRQYLAMEQALGIRLSDLSAPAPVFPSAQPEKPRHTVFVAIPGWPRYLDFQLTDFAEVAAELRRTSGDSWRFTVITCRNTDASSAFEGLPVDVVCEPEAATCVDLFASAELVIGTDTGLTQLAALTGRADGTRPCVVGLYSRHAYTKWITGLPTQHAIATRLAQMLALADRTAEPAELAEAAWGTAADLRKIPATVVAEFAAGCIGRG